jgi:hypothetical protein
MRRLFILIILIAPLTSIAQNCDCKANFDYMVKSITDNYAGYNDKITAKNKKEFQAFTKALRNKSILTKSLDSCYINLKTWTNYFMDNHLRVQLDWKFRKKNPEVANQLNKFFSKKASTQRFAEKLDPKTSIKILDSSSILIRLPSFEWNEKKVIDSLLTRNEIKQKDNWIIDLRGNNGGTDYSFNGLIPFIYSDPIQIKPDEYLSTKENIRILESNLADSETSAASKELLNNVISLMKQHPNQFVNPSGKDNIETKLDRVYQSPLKVAILIDRNTASSAESFLLRAIQSKKVKIYGENSAGLLDYSNSQFFDIPCEDFNLIIPIARSKRLPEKPIDNIGITPNVQIDPNLPEKVNFILKLMKKQGQ